MKSNRKRNNAEDSDTRCGWSHGTDADGLKTFESLEHRLENCGIVAGIRLFNDSKATNVDSVLVAMDSFERGKAIFLLGGRDKNTPLDELVFKAKEQLKGVVWLSIIRSAVQ